MLQGGCRAIALDLLPAALVVVCGAEAFSAVWLVAAWDLAAREGHAVFAFRCQATVDADLAGVLAAVEANGVAGIAVWCLADSEDAAFALWGESTVTELLCVVFFAQALCVVSSFAAIEAAEAWFTRRLWASFRRR